MSSLPCELFLALRYLRPRRTFVSVITLISVIGVTLGVAVLIIVIAVMSGFDREWRDRILSCNAHLKVVKPPDNILRDYALPMSIVSTNPAVEGVAPFVMGQVLIKSQPLHGQAFIRAPVVRGVDPFYEPRVSVIHTSVVRGVYNLEGRGLIVGSEIARGMNLNVGDHLAVYSERSLEQLEKSRGQTNAAIPVADDYEVRGVFDVGFNDFNDMMVVTSLENAQDLYGLDNAVHGLFVKLKDPFQAEMVAQELAQHLDPELETITWMEENSKIFGALMSEKNMMFYLLFFIMIVAAFGITNSQITFVVHKTREIGLLKALGASGRQVMWIFLSQSVAVGVIGVSLGLGLGLLALAYRNPFLHLMTQVTGRELLPAAIYQIHELPAQIMASDLAIICGGSFLIAILAGLFPAWKAGRLEPVEALRHD
jgi:lipoprotein-releasing system permease protein